MHVRGNSVRRAIFNVLNVGRRRRHRGFNFLLSTLGCNAPPRTNLTFNLSHLAVLLANASGVHSIVTFPGAATTTYLVARTPDFTGPATLTRLDVRIIGGTRGG